MTVIDYGSRMENGKIANFTTPPETADQMYQNWESSFGFIYTSPEKRVDGVGITFFNSTLRHELTTNENGEVVVATAGNTVERICPAKPEGVISCEDCAVAGILFAQRDLENCARANTELAFAQADVMPEARFVLTPTSSDVYVFGSEAPGTVVKAGGVTAFTKLDKAQAVVFTESAVKELGYEKIGIGMNGADSTFGTMTVEIAGERFVTPFCSTRENMGDRSEEEQILRKAINAILDYLGLQGDVREQAVSDMKVSVDIGAQARLRTFAHKIKAKEGESPAQVLNKMYPGALERGNIWPQFEAEAADEAMRRGIEWKSPITPGNCPGDGQTCHVDYPKETKYSVEKQLRLLGIKDENLTYNYEDAMDSADIDNNMASNRAEQNQGVERNKTNRTLNAVVVSFGEK